MSGSLAGFRPSPAPDGLARFRRVSTRSPGERVASVLLGSAFLALAAGSTAAQQWQIRPNASLELRYDDNVRLTTKDKENSFVSNARAAVRAVHSTENSNIGLAAGLRLTRYSDAMDLDNTSGFLGLDSAYTGERNRFGLNASFDTQSTLTSEAATSGLTQINKQRYRFVVRPSWTYQISERSSFDLDLSYMDVIYEDTDLTPLFDYRLGNLTLGGSYRLTERAGLNGRLDYGRYEAQQVGTEYDNVGAQLGADYLITETLSLEFLFGLRRTEAAFADPRGLRITQDSTDPIYTLNLAKRFEARGSLNLQAIRELIPSGTGEVLDTTVLSLRIDYPFTERWRFGLDARGYRNRQPGGEPSLTNRKYATATLRMAYALSPSWNLRAGYRHRWQKRNNLPDGAHSNAVFLTLSWDRPWNL